MEITEEYSRVREKKRLFLRLLLGFQIEIVEILIDLDREFRGKRLNEDEPNDEVERRKSIWSAKVSIFFF